MRRRGSESRPVRTRRSPGGATLAQRLCRWVALAALWAGAGALSGPVEAARWITPAYAPGAEPAYKPVPLYWFEVKETPFAYRTLLTAKKGLTEAVAEARSPGYLYVFVDGRPVYQYTPGEREAPNPQRPHAVDLTPHLTPGRHALVVSAPREGFGLAGRLRYGRETVALESGGHWRVLKLAPTVILEDQPWMLPTAKEQGAPVAAGAEFRPSVPFDRLAAQSLARRAVKQYDDTRWRLGLLAHRGITVLEGSAYGWAGPSRVHPAVLSRAIREYRWLAQQQPRVDRLRGSAGSLPPYAEMSALSGALAATAGTTDLLSRQQWLLDELKALGLAARVVPGAAGTRPSASRVSRAILGAKSAAELEPIARELRAHRDALTAAWGGTLNVLNESRHDRLGWLPHPDLVDSQIGSWGLRVGPVTAPTTLTLDGRDWLFQTDPGDTGESEKRQTIGYNIENQWPKVSVPGSWTARDATKSYRGAAWYRTRVTVPAEWRGHDAALRFEARDSDKVWVNDVLVGSSSSPGFRRYTLGRDVLRPGAENVLAIKVTGSGPERGLTGSVTLSCPDLEGGQSSGREPAAAVLATPLSPAVVLTPQDRVLEIQGWAERKQPGPREVLLPSRKPGGTLTRLASGKEYLLSRDGRLPANWALLWMSSSDAEAPDRPVMLVFERQPLRITHAGRLVRITFRGPGARVVAVRPWAKRVPAPGSAPFRQAVAFWQRAALALPVNYLCLTRVTRPGPPPGFAFSVRSVPPGPTLQHTVVYDYLNLKDDWGTAPLKVAPMPALGSYGIDCRFRGLKLAGRAPEILQDGGLLAPYRGVRGTDRITYSYPVEPWPRLIGFTSWMFSYADSGVPGNLRELELLRTTGANSYRPQHNFSTEISPFYGPDNRRTRVEVLADYCRDQGMTYINNIDQTLGDDRRVVQTQYDAFMERVNRHYESIARQLHDRPFSQVAYDLINEPFDHKHEAYNRAMKTLTARVRAIDPVHLLYIEPCEAWGAIQQLRLIEPTGDPLTVYSFHDYNFRLFRPEDRWPTEERDISSICRQWTEAFRFAIQHGVGMHCGEFGGFDNSTDNELAQLTLMNDFFRIFDQFGMHHHYYSGRGLFARRADGSMALSNVARAYRAYLRPVPQTIQSLPPSAE